MSVYAEINDAEPAFFASVVGWSEVVALADSLSVGQFPSLIHLTEHGYSENVSRLESECVWLSKSPDVGGKVAATLKELAALLDQQDGTVIITNGVSSDDEEPSQEELDDEPSDKLSRLLEKVTPFKAESLQERVIKKPRRRRPQPNITVNVPASPPQNVTINVPETKLPEINPTFNVNVPEQQPTTINVESPTVNVAAPNVDVQVNPELKVTMPEPKGFAIIRDEDGNIIGSEPN